MHIGREGESEWKRGEGNEGREGKGRWDERVTNRPKLVRIYMNHPRWYVNVDEDVDEQWE